MFNPRDQAIAPDAPGARTADWQALCDTSDGTRDVPVSYAFGGSAPSTVKLGVGLPTTNLPVGYARMFVEFTPYAWNVNNPNYSGT